MSFATNGSAASVNTAASTGVSVSAASAFTTVVEATPLDKAKTFLAGKYACRQIAAATTYPTDGHGAGRVVLNIPASDVQSSEDGWASLKLCFLTYDAEGTPFVKIGLSYLLDGLGNAVILTRGGSSEGSSANWRNITSNKIPLGALLVSGYFTEDASKEIAKWAQAGGDKPKKFYLPVGTNLEIVLKVNARPWQESSNANSRIVSKAQPGEETGLGMHKIGFAGALVLATESSLINAPAPDVEVPRTLAEILSHFGMRPVALLGGSPSQQPTYAAVAPKIPSNSLTAGLTDASGEEIPM